MKARLAATAVSMSEFKRSPAAVLRGANLRPVAVLNHIVEPRLFKAMMDELADQELYCRASSRLVNQLRAIEVDIDEL